MHKSFQGAVGKYFATIFPKKLQVTLHMGSLLGALAVLCYLVLWLHPPYNTEWSWASAGLGCSTGLSGLSWSNSVCSVDSPKSHWPNVSVWRFWGLICGRSGSGLGWNAFFRVQHVFLVAQGLQEIPWCYLRGMLCNPSVPATFLQW